MIRVKRQKPIFMLVGNKCDKVADREVSRAEGAALARTFGCDFMETSAKTAVNVESLFMTLVRALRATKEAETGPPGTSRNSQDNEPGKKKIKCIIL